MQKENKVEYHKRYYQEHRKQQLEYSKQYYINHPECREQKREYRKEHPEQRKEYSKKYRQEHREHINEYGRKWKREHREQVGEYNRKYYEDFRQKIIKKYGSKCVRCGFSDARALQIDHVHGGGAKEVKKLSSLQFLNRVLTNTNKKYQLLCANCNWIKRYENGEMNKEKKFLNTK